MKRWVSMVLVVMLMGLSVGLAQEAQRVPHGVYSPDGQLLFCIGDTREQIEAAIGKPIDYVGISANFDPEAYVAPELAVVEQPDVLAERRERLAKALRAENPTTEKEVDEILTRTGYEGEEIDKVTGYSVSMYDIENGNLHEALLKWEAKWEMEHQIDVKVHKSYLRNKEIIENAKTTIGEDLYISYSLIEVAVDMGSLEHPYTYYPGVVVRYKSVKPLEMYITCKDRLRWSMDKEDPYDTIEERNDAIVKWISDFEEAAMTDCATGIEITGANYVTHSDEYVGMSAAYLNLDEYTTYYYGKKSKLKLYSIKGNKLREISINYYYAIASMDERASILPLNGIEVALDENESYIEKIHLFIQSF